MPSNSTLVFIDTDEDYSTYEDSDGNDVYLAHGWPLRRLVPYEELDLEKLWEAHVKQYAWNPRPHIFMEHLQSLTIEPDEVEEEVRFCADCSSPDWTNDTHCVEGGDTVCEACYQNYYWCSGCEESCRNTRTIDSNEVCNTCIGNHYSYCENCDDYIHEHDDEHGHDSEGDGCCESPALSFAIRNDGEEPLRNDVSATITLPAGEISDEGIGTISRYLREYTWKIDQTEEAGSKEAISLMSLTYAIQDALGSKWQTKDGNYTKRLSRLAYKSYGLKLRPEIVSRVGCIARDHSTAVNFNIEITRDLNQSAEDFAHSESCWWQSYYHGRCALKTNGGFGLRTFTDDSNWGRCVNGRAWVMPLRNTEDGLRPTFDAETPAAYVVFNGYGDLSGYAPARILAHMLGMTYRKIEFTCEPMYVNNNSGYIVAPEEIANGFTDGALYLEVDQHSSLYNTERAHAHV